MNTFKYLPLVLFLLLVMFLWRGMAFHPAEVPSPLINKKVPDFQLPNLIENKKIFTQQELIGHVSLLNVWASWCFACANEHETLMQISPSHEYVLYGIDYKDDKEEAMTWLKNRGNPYQQVGFDADGRAAIDLGVYGLPETFIIDKKGMIRYKYLGPITSEIWATELKPIVDSLARESS